MAGRERVSVSLQGALTTTKTELNQRLQTLRATTPGYTQMDQAIKNTARSV